VKEYYDTRAPEYDEWYLGEGMFARRDRPGWEQDLHALAITLAGLPTVPTLDVACGTGFLTQYLPGPLTALDQSERMLAVARRRVPEANLITGDALELGFDRDAFGRVFTGHFYGHLLLDERRRFLTGARRVAAELIVVESAKRPDHDSEEWQERVLNDGSRFSVYKRYFEPGELVKELGGGSVLHEGPWFVAVRSPRDAGSAGHRGEHH
jgi:ubiquinone/menaquinone biosynthesis C-methylase UbiE